MQLAVQGLVVVLRGAAEVVVIFVMVETGRRVEGMEAAVAAGTVAGMSMHHRPQEGSLRPVMETRPWLITSTVVLSKITLQPLTVRAPTYIRDPDVRNGKICTRLAATGRLGRGRIPLCVDYIEVPSGRRTFMGCMMRWMSVMGQHIMT